MTVLLLAAGHAYLIRYRQVKSRPSTAPSDLQRCKDLAETYRKQFEQLVGGAVGGSAAAWPGMGL